MKTSHWGIAVIAALAMAIPVRSSHAGDAYRIDEFAPEAHRLYNEAVARGLGEPYLAPLSSDPNGPWYLWGGLDPISVIDEHDDDIADDPGQLLFIDRKGKDLGSPGFPLEVERYPGGPTDTAIFKSAENRARFELMSANGTLVIAFGMNCHWGIIAGPATNFRGHSHWAQPGLAAVVVERAAVNTGIGPKKTITYVGANLYKRGDDWNATSRRWEHAVEAFSRLLAGQDGDWDRKREGVPILDL